MLPIVQKFIQDAGSLTTSLGLGRAVGQVYAYLYFSREPRGLADLQEALGISKGSASMVVRQLEQWGAVRKIWVKGDRKDYYEANDWLGQILRNIIVDTIGKRLTQSNGLLTSDLRPPTTERKRSSFGSALSICASSSSAPGKCGRIPSSSAWYDPSAKPPASLRESIPGKRISRRGAEARSMKGLETIPIAIEHESRQEGGRAGSPTPPKTHGSTQGKGGAS